MENKKKILGAIVVLGICLIMVIVGVLYTKSRNINEPTNEVSYIQEVKQEKPVDIALDFYNKWLDAVVSTTTTPYATGLASEKILSDELRAVLIASERRLNTEIDPILCQTTTPMRATGRVVSTGENEARILIMAKEKELTAQSVFTLKRIGDGWFIDSVACTPGEFAPLREFSFEKEGYLLKNLPAPFDPQNWHIVFIEDGEEGHVVPLFFDTKTVCRTTPKTDAPCVPDQFMSGTKIHVYSQMTERGAEVKRLEFIE
ncbi:hypothetical protein IPH92_01880 [Candidatus Kaiserbacteria bacterium]|nr:MAG: hypothetical protein IPH92_01880 [Candidatus Kaiserbacteria bacterium]